MIHPVDLTLAATYTADDVIKILVEVGVLLGILGGIVTNILQTSYTRKDVQKNTEITAKGLTEVNKTAAVIEGHVNSQTTKLSTEIDGLRNENSQLKQQIAETKQTAAVLATNVAHAPIAHVDIQPQIAQIAADVAVNKAAIEELKQEPKP